MNAAGFALLAVMIGAYVLLDGYDLGVAAIAPLTTRTPAERAAAMSAIGPFWNGNEVWLIAAGGALFALFPKAYASAFSGFYLPFVVVLWLLMFRGLALELRNHFQSELWHTFWDSAFFASSAALIVLFGVALGNLLRGVPLDRRGYFSGTFAFLLNPYAVGVGIFALFALAQHGLTFLTLRVDGPPARRARRVQSIVWWFVLLAYLLVTVATFVLRAGSVHHAAWLAFLPLPSLLALGAVRFYAARGEERGAFVASAAFLASLLLAAAGTMFPYLLPAYPARAGGLSIYDAAPSPSALATTLTVTIVGLCAVVAYTIFTAGRMAGKIRAPE